jgi:hypothetical protein
MSSLLLLATLLRKFLPTRSDSYRAPSDRLRSFVIDTLYSEFDSIAWIVDAGYTVVKKSSKREIEFEA